MVTDSICVALMYSSAGLQPLMYSEKEREVGWRRVGYNIRYCSGHKEQHSTHVDKEIRNELFTLSWTMVALRYNSAAVSQCLRLVTMLQEFPESDDRCYLAHCYPYPFSKLLSHINQLEHSLTTHPHVQCEELCKTLAGNSCPLLTITDFQGTTFVTLCDDQW